MDEEIDLREPAYSSAVALLETSVKESELVLVAVPVTIPDPVLAWSVDELDRLRERVDLVRVRVSDWRAELDCR